MKKFGKILSSVLVASMLVSAFAMNAMAASKAHTLTISADKTEGLVAGDTVTIELAMDNTEALVSCQYQLNYDVTAFTADTTKVSRVEKCVDKAWLDGIKDTDGDWGYYLGSPTYKVNAETGFFNFAWAGSEGVEADYAMDNRVIGKFYLTVAEGAADGTYTFTVTGANTMDAGESVPTDSVCAPITVTVGAPAPTTVAKYFAASFTPGVKSAANNAIEFSFKDGEKEAKKAVYYGNVVMENLESVVTAVEVTEVPADSALELVGTEWTTVE